MGPCTFALETALRAYPGETALLSLLIGLTAETVAARSIDTDEELLAISAEMTAIMASLGLDEDDVFLREEWTPRYIELDGAWSRRFDGMGRDVIEPTSPVMTRLLVAPRLNGAAAERRSCVCAAGRVQRGCWSRRYATSWNRVCSCRIASPPLE